MTNSCINYLPSCSRYDEADVEQYVASLACFEIKRKQQQPGEDWFKWVKINDVDNNDYKYQ